ncbi:MAG: GNAT family N-acetyltransferase [Firmicutes bacterium]|nr:GNAT family N-acetyltransferase [Bacillota bacterium]
MSHIEIKPVITKKDQRKFIRLQWRLYQNDPNWVPPLILDMKNVFNPKKNALLTLGPYQYFLAYRDGQPVGRIGVGIDQHLNRVKGYKSSYLTLFESVNDYSVAKALFDHGLDWAKKNGAEFITGPQSPTNGDDYRGLLIKGFDSPPVLMSSYNPPYYQDFFEKYGFAKQFDRNAYYLDVANSPIPDKISKGVEYAKNRYEFRVAPIDMKHFKEQVEAIVQVSTAAWPEDWPDMVPPSPEEVRAEVSKLRPFIKPELVFLAWDKNNRPIGYGVTFPDYNQVIKKMNGRLFPLGWLIFLLGQKKITATRSFILFTIPEYQNKGVSSAIYLEGYITARKLGYKWADFSSIHDFNTKMNQDAVGAGGELYKIFRIYKKDLI